MPYANLTFQVQPGLRFVPNDFVNVYVPTTTTTTTTTATPTTTTTTTPPPTTTTTTTAASPIVTAGLVLNLDASNPASYSGTGSTWYDLSTSGNNATLINSPTFSSNNGGYITTNGTSSYVDITNNATLDDNTVTVSVWLQYTTVTAAGSGYGSIISIGSSSGTYNGWNLYIYQNVLNAQIKTNPSPSETNITGTTLSTATWYNITLVAVSGGTSYLYLNNVLLNSASTIGFTVTNAQPLRIARAVDPFWSYFGGNLGQITLYNRALSTLELTQNYNNTKTRFGL